VTVDDIFGRGEPSPVPIDCEEEQKSDCQVIPEPHKS
jgi:hypothetical protein